MQKTIYQDIVINNIKQKTTSTDYPSFPPFFFFVSHELSQGGETGFDFRALQPDMVDVTCHGFPSSSARDDMFLFPRNKHYPGSSQ